jgi:hypothetical protein
MRSRQAAQLVSICLCLSAPAAAQKAASRLDSLDFSGILFANFQYHADSGATKGSNKFDVERIYLTFRMPVGEHLGVRVTTDIFQPQSTDGTVKGWLLRAKYAYLQYDYGDAKKLGGFARFGIVPTVIIDQEENFWPRFISQVDVDRAGLVSPADGGVAGVLRFPDSTGEIYGAVSNGPGYASRETDRFKDYSARLSLTPLTSRTGLLQHFTFIGWIYRGAVGSKFAASGAGELGSIGSSLPRNRWGLFAGLRDPRITAGGHYGSTDDASESGSNTSASPRVAHDSSGRFASVFTSFKPARLLSPGSKSNLGIVLRYDDFTTNRASGTGYRFFVSGVTEELSARVRVALDYQSQNPKNGVTAPLTRTYFLHLAASF